MHLKQLKLAGFKSFVDPEIVYFPSQLVAVVGSNGCGKSNIIDAVRWVMGESSAKNLRGESMVDVIFNGSSSRKPLGQASVELLFDNSLGRLGGAYASYQEIAVKRLVTRAGDSQYFLNGTRCRRRDITDLFLGTGAGVKGYSIIGQDTISRLIVAKPEELRLFLEEAAGVSKYKERRRETLQRIAHTQDNLTRVADITEELSKQLQKLERQAKAAERYNKYKEEERQCKAEILAIKWQDLMQKMQGMHQELSQLNLNFEQLQSQLTSCTQERIHLNEQLQNSTGQSQQKQEAFYQLSTQIARLEEVLQQQARDKKRLEHERQKVLHDLQLLQEQLQQDEDTLEHSQSKVIELKSQLEALEIEFTEQESLWQNLKQNNSQKEREWQEVQQCTNALRRDLQVSKINIQHLHNKKQQAHIQLEKLSLKEADLSLEDLLKEKQNLEEKALQLIQTEQESETQVKQCTDKQDSLRQQLQDIVQQLHQQQDCFHKINTEQAALLAIQKAAKQRNKAHESIKQWADKPRLMELVQVEKTWEKALESILGATLCAYVVKDIEELKSNLHQTEAGQIVTMGKLPGTSQTYPSLASKILSAIPASMYHLDSIYTAKDLEEALSWLPNLQAHESIIIATGVRLGPGWVSFPDIQEQEEMGLLELQQKIQQQAQELPKFQELIENLTTARDDCQGQVHQVLKELEQAQIYLSANRKAVQVHNVALTKVAQNIHHTQLQIEQLVVEIDNQKINLEEAQYELAEIEEQYQNLEKQLQQQECIEAQLVTEKQLEQEACNLARQQLDDCRGLKHQTELAYQSELIKTQQIKERLFREGLRAEELQEHLEQLLLQSTALETPEQTYTEQLEELIAEHSALEVELAASRDAVSQHKLAIEAVEKKHSFHEVEAKKLQEQIAHNRLQEQALALKANSAEELLAESNLEAEQLLQAMTEDATQIMKEEALLALSKKIQALGAINLAAIEEYTTEKQRKDYLDAQCDDLRQALATLQTAIEQIDKETLLRLENTFDEVNTAFKALFPRLFGGGQAQLELTCDNLLEAGIVVMAQPPGKRNNTIHLLSGGEKAMTAVALVFAIFQLNPSPFCMLDEVDAPLDDTNVGRFCDLVKEMSQFVQFLFITHNKVTMEMADHLIGVTMREPGVSRLVTVDVKQVLYDYGVNHADKLELNS